MNIKFHLALIGVTILLIATACSSAKVSTSALDPAQPATRNDKAVVLVPITGEQSSDVAQDLKAYPSQRLHRYCALEGSQKQANCVEKEPNVLTGPTLFSSNNNADVHAYPSQQLHSNCVSKDSQHQESCLP